MLFIVPLLAIAPDKGAATVNTLDGPIAHRPPLYPPQYARKDYQHHGIDGKQRADHKLLRARRPVVTIERDDKERYVHGDEQRKCPHQG